MSISMSIFQGKPESMSMPMSIPPKKSMSMGVSILLLMSDSYFCEKKKRQRYLENTGKS